MGQYHFFGENSVLKAAVSQKMRKDACGGVVGVGSKYLCFWGSLTVAGHLLVGLGDEFRILLPFLSGVGNATRLCHIWLLASLLVAQKQPWRSLVVSNTG